MRKKVTAVITVLVMVLTMFSFSVSVSAYSYGKETDSYDFEDKVAQIGQDFGGGALSQYNAGIAKFAANDAEKLPDGGNVAVKVAQNFETEGEYKQVQCNLHFGKAEGAPFGDSRVSFDLYRGATNYPFKIDFKGYTNTVADAGTWISDFSTPVEFRTGGALYILGTNVGNYDSGLYKFQFDFLHSQKKVVVTLVSGKVSGELKENTILGEKAMTTPFSFFQLFLIQNPGTSVKQGEMEDWFDNLKREALPNVWTSPEMTKIDGVNTIAPGTETIHFVTPRFLENTDTSSWFTLKKDGTVLDASAYTVTGTEALAKAGTPDSKVACDPVITFAGGWQPGEYELAVNVKDTYGKDIPSVTFTVLSEAGSCDIKGVAEGSGLTLTNDSISGLLKGTKTADLKNSITLPTGATVKVGNGEQEPTYLFGGEQITVTSANGENTKTYTLIAQADAYSYDFNDSKLASELESAQIPNAANRKGNLTNVLANAFPAGGFGQYYAAAPTSGQEHFIGANAPGKTDRSGSIANIEYVGAANTPRFSGQMITDWSADKNYVFNVSVRPAADEATHVQIMAGNRNSGKILGKVEFNVANHVIKVTSKDNQQISNAFDLENWYTVSFYVSYDKENSKFIVKNFINGEYLAEGELAMTEDELAGVSESNQKNVSLLFGHYHKAKTEEAPYMANAYIDNVSFYECAPIENNVLPNGFNFVPTVTPGLVTFDNLRATVTVPWMTAKELCDAFVLPDGVTAEVHSADETAKADDNATVTNGMKLVLKNGEVWKTYTIKTAFSYTESETGRKAALTLSQDMPAGTYLLAAYQNGVLADVELANKTAGEAVEAPLAYYLPEGANASEYTFKAFLFENIGTLRPLLKAGTFRTN